jgi:hypothetical protein
MTEKAERPDRYAGPERRREREDDGPFAGLPVWVRGLAVVGIPGGIALFLVWIGASYIPQIATELSAFRLEAERSRLAVERQINQNDQSYRMLQRICAEVAKTDEGRSRCFER